MLLSLATYLFIKIILLPRFVQTYINIFLIDQFLNCMNEKANYEYVFST